MREWSNYQKAVFDFVQNTKDSAVINAVAGSGKTTVIVEASKIATKFGSTLFLAFNRAIAQELGERMKGTSVECMTLHSHGLRAIKKKFNFNGVTIDERKWNKYIDENEDELIGDMFFETDTERTEYIRDIVKLLNLARINLIRMDESGKCYELSDIVEHHNLDIEDMQMQIVNKLLGECYKVDSVVDFTDMITLPLNESMKRFIPKYDTVFIDESQDLSKAQRELMLASIKPNGRFIGVGDKKQCINGFAGSDIEGFNTLIELAHHELPLSICYRCGKRIITEAQSIIPYIEPFDKQIDGEVVHQRNLRGLENGDMVICRKSAPLVSVCLKLIANGRSAQVKGRDIADGLKSIVKKAKTNDIEKMLDKIQREITKVANRLNRVGYDGKLEEQPQYINIVDKIECIQAISDSCEDVEELMQKLDTLFTDTKSGNVITLSTIHKAKGLEADNVYILLPDCLPMRYKGQQPWEFEQEMNLKYVAITRAKKRLVWVDLTQLELAKVEI